MLKSIVNDLTNPKFNNHTLYIHNFSLFDAIFLFKYIVNLKSLDYKVDILKREDKFISITISKKGKDKKDSFYLTIYDSYLILPHALKRLSEAFKVEGKLDFNVLDNDTNDLNNPDFKSKLLEYNKQDCKALYDVLVTFNSSFMDMFKMTIWGSPTLPSLAFKLWKANFVNKNSQIPITWWEEYPDFKEAYRGGAVDVYKPYGENLYYYDVNSLYPYVMKTNLFPCGEQLNFSVNKELNDIFGIVYYKVSAPKDLYAPILLTKTLEGKVIAPTGSWSGWYCSEELKHAVKYGYQVEVIQGYHWSERSDLFSEYVNTLYNYRLTFDKNDPRNTICKLLLNSLYGKLGMSPVLMSYSIWEDNEYESLADVDCDDIQHIGEVTILGRESTKNLLSSYKYCRDKRIYFPLLQISTPIAIFTTAYARMHMAQYKIKYADNLYYSDTDSLILDIPLPENLVGGELGQFKLEYEIKEAIFIAPKVYALLLKDGRVRIRNKGYKEKDLTMDHFRALLKRDSHLTLSQEKWFRDLSLGNIQITDTTYTLRATNNKRDFIFDSDGVLVNTKPIFLE